MLKLGLIKEGKVPADNRVVFTPGQCKWIQANFPDLRVIVQSSPGRCFSDREYRSAGVEVVDDISGCDILLGVKEVPVDDLIAGKTYLFFSHTRKKQPYNRRLLQEILRKRITLIDYECLEHDDGERLIGFGFFAGVVGAHNGMMAYGNRTGSYQLGRVYQQRSFRELIHTYFGLRLPPVKVVVTGSGRVAHGILEIMNLMEVHEVEPEAFLTKEFNYPVYTQLKGSQLYTHRDTGTYNRDDFHANPGQYKSKFLPYTRVSDILMNGIYWEESIPRLFEKNDVKDPAFRICTIADITDDEGGSVPINLGDQTIENPVYGVDRQTLLKTDPYLPGSIDVMAVGNLPNELARDASRYFGEQLIKHVLGDLLNNPDARVIKKATITSQGRLADDFMYLRDYVGQNQL